MAYFANGSEGDRLDELCGKCIHGGQLCPVWLLAWNWNYSQLTHPDQKVALDALMPDSDGVLCAVFTDSYELEKSDAAV